MLKSGATNPIVIDDSNCNPNDNNCNDTTANINNGEEFWIRNDLYNLKKEDPDILHSQSAWLNDRTMDAVQKLIHKALGDERRYRFVLNTLRKVIIPSRPVSHNHIQLGIIH